MGLPRESRAPQERPVARGLLHRQRTRVVGRAEENRTRPLRPRDGAPQRPFGATGRRAHRSGKPRQPGRRLSARNGAPLLRRDRRRHPQGRSEPHGPGLPLRRLFGTQRRHLGRGGEGLRHRLPQHVSVGATRRGRRARQARRPPLRGTSGGSPRAVRQAHDDHRMELPGARRAPQHLRRRDARRNAGRARRRHRTLPEDAAFAPVRRRKRLFHVARPARPGHQPALPRRQQLRARERGGEALRGADRDVPPRPLGCGEVAAAAAMFANPQCHKCPRIPIANGKRTGAFLCRGREGFGGRSPPFFPSRRLPAGCRRLVVPLQRPRAPLRPRGRAPAGFRNRLRGRRTGRLPWRAAGMGPERTARLDGHLAPCRRRGSRAGRTDGRRLGSVARKRRSGPSPLRHQCPRLACARSRGGSRRTVLRRKPRRRSGQGPGPLFPALVQREEAAVRAQRRKTLQRPRRRPVASARRFAVGRHHT